MSGYLFLPVAAVDRMLGTAANAAYQRHECGCLGDGILLAQTMIGAMAAGASPDQAALDWLDSLTTAIGDEVEVCTHG